jgi:hypothetical protein
MATQSVSVRSSATNYPFRLASVSQGYPTHQRFMHKVTEPALSAN